MPESCLNNEVHWLNLKNCFLYLPLDLDPLENKLVKDYEKLYDKVPDVNQVARFGFHKKIKSQIRVLMFPLLGKSTR